MQNFVKAVLNDAELARAVQQAGAAHRRVDALPAATPWNLQIQGNFDNVLIYFEFSKKNLSNMFVSFCAGIRVTSLVSPRAMSQSIKVVLVLHTAYQSLPKIQRILSYVLIWLDN